MEGPMWRTRHTAAQGHVGTKRHTAAGTWITQIKEKKPQIQNLAAARGGQVNFKGLKPYIYIYIYMERKHKKRGR